MSDIQEWKVEEPWLESNCGLAEGPFYEKETDSLRFLDIKKKQILYAHGVSSPDAKQSFPMSSVEVIQLDVAPSVTSDIEGVDPREKILLGVKYGLSTFDRKTGQYKMLVPFDEKPNERVRANDGAADPHGRFLLGSMTDFGQGHFRPEGSLFRFTKDTSKEALLAPVTIPNGIGWSPDLKTMYFTHSPTREVFKFDYDLETGDLSNQHLFYKHPTTGEPDGLRVDVEGNIWQAFYGEHMVLKINPAGEVVGKVNIPARNITCVQFVDEDLFITTAAEEEGQASNQVTKYGGSIFRVNVGVKGVDLFKFKL